jgi:glycosyltransferase involved in cell wall biosynthesis
MKTAPDAVITSHYLLLDAVPTPLLSRTVHHVHTSFSETMNQQANAKTLLRFNGKISFLWLSKNILRSAQEAGFLFSHYLYNPLSRFPAERTRAEQQKDVVLLTRFSEEKRLPLAVELCRRAMEKIPFHQQGRVLFYGAGPEEEALRQAIGEDPRFVIMGRTDDPYAALQSARFTLNTSRFEGFSIAVLEAAAAGVPTLSFCFGEAASEEIADGITGRLIPMDENEAFVSALCALWTEDETVRALSEEARHFALGFTKEKSGEALLAILSRLPLDKTEKES